jgi:hypothetical protein
MRTQAVVRTAAALCLVVASAWLSLGAAGAAAAAADCGTTAGLPGGAVRVQGFAELRDAVAAVAIGESRTFYLGASIEATASESLAIAPGATVALDLDGCDLAITEPGEGDAAIAVPGTARLTVEDTSSNLLAEQGTLEASGGAGEFSGGAGIGGGGGEFKGSGGGAGSVTVSGGSITASGGPGGNTAGGGAGIGGGGGGYEGSGGAAGSVTVSGGSVTASGGPGGSAAGGGAGVGGGGGGFEGDGGAGGTVTVSGGGIGAFGGTGFTDGAGFGGGGEASRGGRPLDGSVTVEPGPGPAPSLVGELAAMLTVQGGATLSVPAEETLALDEYLDLNDGMIEVAGTLAGEGQLENEGSIAVRRSGWSVAGYRGPGGAPDGGLSITGNAFELSFSVSSGTAPEEMWVFAPTLAAGGESLPAGTTWAGRPFEGWYTSSSGGVAVTDSSDLRAVLGRDRTLYAHYGVAPQTITFPTIASHTLDEGDIEPGATASSGLPVTYTSQTRSVCTIVSGEVHLSATGICTVVAEQGGDPGYAAAESVTRSFAVLGGPQEVLSPTQTPGAPPAAASPPAAAPAPRIVLLHTPDTPHRPDRPGRPRWTFVFTDAAPGVTYLCRLDTRPWRSCGSPTVLRHLARGPHLFRLRSVDAAGEGSPVESVRFRVGRRGVSLPREPRRGT